MWPSTALALHCWWPVMLQLQHNAMQNDQLADNIAVPSLASAALTAASFALQVRRPVDGQPLVFPAANSSPSHLYSTGFFADDTVSLAVLFVVADLMALRLLEETSATKGDWNAPNNGIAAFNRLNRWQMQLQSLISTCLYRAWSEQRVCAALTDEYCRHWWQDCLPWPPLDWIQLVYTVAVRQWGRWQRSQRLLLPLSPQICPPWTYLRRYRLNKTLLWESFITKQTNAYDIQ